MSWHVDFVKPSRKGLSKRGQIARYGDMTVQHHHTDHTISLFIDLPFCMKPDETWHKFANLWSIWPWQGLGSLRTWIHSSASKLASDYRSIIDLYSIMIYWQIVTFVYICNSFAYICGLFPNFANQINIDQPCTRNLRSLAQKYFNLMQWCLKLLACLESGMWSK